MISMIEGFKAKNNLYLLEKAEKLKPCLVKEKTEGILIEGNKDLPLGKGDRIVFDFQDHQVGYPTLKLSYSGSHPDAPVFLHIKFAERKKELKENSSEYDGWISKSWIQEEWVHVDYLPTELHMERRYAFRYLEIEVIDTSVKFKVQIPEAYCISVSSAQTDQCRTIPGDIKDPVIQKIYKVAIRTLHNCMQDVFEDGPKRDRRLWSGDLRLQARANYKTFENNDLVKRCLYLFAGSTFPDGRVSACIFTEPEPTADDTYMADYALFFIVMLQEYYEQTKDREALEDLYPTAVRQMDYIMGRMPENGIIDEEKGSKEGSGFIDWNEELDKQAAMQGILIYSLKFGILLAEEKKDDARVIQIKNWLTWLEKSAKKYLFNPETGLFHSGKERQISVTSQVWMVLAGVLPKEKNREIMTEIKKQGLPVRMMTPYMNSYYCEALLACEMYQEAEDFIREYWGKMTELGADTFWEIFDPADPEASPYGGSAVNSYCHAWSCTPIILLEKCLKGKTI